MKYLSLFSGIGGFELGIQNAFTIRDQVERQSHAKKYQSDDHGILSQKGRHGASCIGYSEIDPYAIKVYERHFDHENFGDITAINATKLPDFDLLVGGFPCQAFSVAGKRRGFDEARGTLFFDIARILKHKRPRHLVLENVKGLLSHDAGQTFQTILGILADLGYRVEWQLLNSKDFGVPQNRERVFIVGHLRERCGTKIFPISSEIAPITEVSRFASQGSEAFIKTRHLSQNGVLISDSATLQATETPHIVANALRSSDGGISERDTLVAVHRNHGVIERTDDEAHTVDSNYYKGMDNHGQRTMIAKEATIRRLTPKECERLQGFPDYWTTLAEDGSIISDTQRYKMTGNAVTTNVVQAVISDLIKECL